MDRPRSQLAVVRAYNEAATVAEVVAALHRDAPEFDVLVVDDGSTDGTGELALDAGAALMRHPFNLGMGAAVQSGFFYALENDYDYMVQVDADGQHCPDQVRLLVEEMERDPTVDLVVGSRFLGDSGYEASRSRRAGIHFFSSIVSRLVDAKVSDPTTGFRLYNRRAIALFARDYAPDYPEVEAFLMLHHHKLKMREVPVRMLARPHGESTINSRESAYFMVKVMLALAMGLARERPVVEPGDEAPVAAARGL
jgi:glycosyltransferase involved in cell wall biosynthesis